MRGERDDRTDVRRRRLERERAYFVWVLGLPQTRFGYRQRLRKAIARRDRQLAALALMADAP